MKDSNLRYPHPQNELDCLLANAGYSVKASELAHVAERLEQLESVLCAAQEASISYLSQDAIHRNPSDMAGWVERTLGQLAPCVKKPNSISNLGTSNSPTSIAAVNFKQQGPIPVHNRKPLSTVSSHGSSCLEQDLEVSYQFKHEKDDYQEGSFTSNFSAVAPSNYPCFVDVPGFVQYDTCTMAMSTGLMQEGQSYIPYHGCTFGHVDAFKLTETDTGIDCKSLDYGGHIGGFDESGKYLSTNGHVNDQPIAKNMHSADVVQSADQECGLRLVHLLLACARAIQNGDLNAAHEMVNEIKVLAYPQTKGAMSKVAAFFVEALAMRIYGFNSPSESQHQQGPADAFSNLLYYHFYEICPYLKFAHFTANQAILEAFQGKKFVHVIDFSLMQGLQWPALIQALALRPGGPPYLRLTGIGPPQADEKDVLQEIGMKIAHFADSVNVEFDFRGIVAERLDDVEPWMFHVHQGEAIAINSVLQLHCLLHRDESTELAPIDEVLRSVKSLRPKVFTIVEQEADHNQDIFEDRFMQALQYYCTMFDSLEACQLSFPSNEVALAEMYLGREIANVVACEGPARRARHETLDKWRKRMEGAGFQPLHLGSNAFKQARMLLNVFSGEGYTVQENLGCLTLGWHDLPLIAASAWQCG